MKQRSNDIKALHQAKAEELQGMLKELELELAQARLARGAQKLTDVASIKRLSDAIARIKTVLRERELVQK